MRLGESVSDYYACVIPCYLHLDVQITFPEICGSYSVISARWKHTQYTGVKGLRGRKSFFESNTKPTGGDEEEAEELDLENR